MRSLIKTYIFLLKNLNKDIYIGKGVKLNASTIMEGKNKIYENTTLYNTSIGIGTYISKNCSINDSIIGRFCSLGPNINVVSGLHPTNTFVSTHPAFFSNKKQAGFTFTNINKFLEHKNVIDDKKVVIGNDVWIGHGVTILEGVTIGDGAIIGANTLVKKNIEPYSINVGIPSKVVGYRFEKNQIEFLKDLKWWNQPFETIKINSYLFDNIKNYMNYER